MVIIREKPEIPLPPVGDNMSPADHLQMSQRFVQHTAIERAKENRLQTSEKIWGSVSQAIIAVGKSRGWDVGDTHSRLQDVAIQLGAELDEANSKRKRRARSKATKQDDFFSRFKVAESQHANFYKNRDHLEAIDSARRNAEAFIKELYPLLDREPTAFTPKDEADKKRLARLLGFGTRNLTPDQLEEMFPERKPDPNGFSPNYGYQKPDIPDNDGDEGNGGGVPNPDPPADDGQGGGATINGGTNLKRREGGLSSNAGERPGKPGPKNRKSRRQAPKAPAAVAAQSSRPGKEQRQVIKPRPAAQRQSRR